MSPAAAVPRTVAITGRPRLIGHTGRVSSTSPPVPEPAPVDPDAARAGNVLPFPARFGAADAVPTGDTSATGGPVVTAPAHDPAADLDPAAGEPGDGDEDGAVEHRDWVWVEEWRAGGESTPWAAGVALAAFAALLVGIAVVVLSTGLAANPIVAVLINLLVAAGLVPAIWLSRDLPVLRWIGLGAAVGVVVGWISAIGMVG